jgi:transmembrane sensor
VDEQRIFDVLSGRAGPDEVRAVTAWRHRSAANEQHCRELERLLELAVHAHAGWSKRDPPSGTELARLWLARADPARAAQLPDSTRKGPLSVRRPYRRHLLPWAAALALAFGLHWLWPGPRPESFDVEELVTGPLETATLSLRDGTVVRLAPASRLRIHGEGRRETSLTGRAYFAVAPQRRHPFLVHTPAGDLTVLGTRFDLEAVSHDLRVIVVEGTVDVAAGNARTRVRAGQVGRVVRGTPLPSEAIGDTGVSLDWVGEFLAFQSTPLAQAAHEIEQVYGVSIEIADSVLAQRTITSWFANWTLDEILEAVCVIAHARCTVEDGRVRVEAKEHAGSW